MLSMINVYSLDNLSRLFKVMRLPVLVLTALCIISCEPIASTSLLLRGSKEPTADCSVDLTGTTFSNNLFLDPSGLSPLLFYAIVENFSNGDSNVAVGPEPNGTSFETSGSTIRIKGFEGCFQRTEDINNANLQNGDEILDCNALATEQNFVVSGGQVVDDDGGRAAIGIEILDQTDLSVIYGNAFRPDLIPIRGQEIFFDANNNLTFDSGDEFRFYTTAEIASNAGRSSHWGNFPQSNSDSITIQFRAIAESSAGKNILSNWNTIETNICPLCVYGECETQVIKQCDATCTSSCELGRIGQRLVSGSCRPFQGIGVSCEEFDSCTL